MIIKVLAKSNKNRIFKKRIYKIFSIYLILLIFIPNFQSKSIRNLNYAYEIKILVEGGSIGAIFKQESKPDKIIVNGEEKDIKSVYQFTEPKNYITLLWNTQPSCAQMFKNINIIKSIDLSNFDSSQITDISEMFSNCNNLRAINFKNFNTISVQSMEYLFYNCVALTSLDLPNFITTSLNNMGDMFNNNINLLSLDLSSFDTSSVTLMRNIFLNCQKLVYLNLISFTINDDINLENFLIGNPKICFDKSKIKKSNTIFDNLKNECDNICFQKGSKISIEEKKCLENCDNEKYVLEINNICYTKFPDGYVISDKNVENSEDNENSIIQEKFEINEILESSENSENQESSEISKESTESIENDETQESSENQESESENQEGSENQESSGNQESNESQGSNENIETSETPENSESPQSIETHESLDNIESSEIQESSENPENSESHKSNESQESNDSRESQEISEINESQKSSENIESQENSESIESQESSESDEIKLNIENIKDSDNIETSKLTNDNIIKDSEEIYDEKLLNKDKIIENIREQIINGSLNSFLIGLLNGTKEDIISEYKDLTYQITTTENQKNNIYNNISTINLGKCEEILKNTYKIDLNLSLIIFKVEYNMDGLLIPVIGYEVYHPLNYSQLDLNYCNESFIKLNIPVNIDENKAFIYDPNSDYYNDECYAYTTENGTDIILNDRKNEYIENNLSLCEDNCAYNGYDSETKKALCECETKIKINLISEIINSENILANNFSTNTDNNANLATMKCISLLFSKNGLLTNIGNYILLFSFVFFLISALIFYKCGYQLIENNIDEIFDKNSKTTINNEINIFNYKKKKTNKKLIKKKKKEKISNPKKKKSKLKINGIKKKNFYKNKYKKKESSSTSKTELKSIKKNNGINNYYLGYLKDNKYKKNKKKKSTNMKKYKELDLNYLSYEKALKYDRRTFFQYYLYLVKIKVPILFEFYPIDDYNLRIIKVSLFFLFFDIYFAVNTLFFTNTSIHQIYKDAGKYNINYFFPKIIYSFIICYIINSAIKYFSLCERNIINLLREKNRNNIEEKKSNTKRCLIIKYILFYLLSILFLIVFWFYLSSFCAVYKNTQIYLIINTFISWVISIIFSFIIIFLPSTFRYVSLNINKPKYKIIYKAGYFMQII